MPMFDVPSELVHDPSLADEIEDGTMHAFGQGGDAPVGRWFINNMNSWRALALYCSVSVPHVASRCHNWYFDNHEGLDNDGAIALADALQSEIDSGRTLAYERIGDRALGALNEGTCTWCDGLGQNHRDVGGGRPALAGEVRIVEKVWLPCSNCEGKGRLTPTITSYEFSVSNVQNFANFARASGGFVFIEDAHRRLYDA